VGIVSWLEVGLAQFRGDIMGDGKREGFLRLTGAGALVRQESGALRIEESMTMGDRHIPLFGSDYIGDGAVPTLTHVLNHIVYWRLRDMTVDRRHITQAQKDAALKESYAQYEGEEVRIVGKIRKRFGGTRSLVVDGSDWNPNDPEARVIMVKNPPEVREGGDHHVLFFTMALKMRQRFAQNALEMFQKIPDSYRSGATLLTEIGTPICTYTRPDIGFDIGCEFSQRLTMDKFDPETLDEGQLFSSTGEYPIELPSNIDVERLMRIDFKAQQNPHLLLGKNLRLEV
jgi:hypothetical protein